MAYAKSYDPICPLSGKTKDAHRLKTQVEVPEGPGIYTFWVSITFLTSFVTILKGVSEYPFYPAPQLPPPPCSCMIKTTFQVIFFSKKKVKKIIFFFAGSNFATKYRKGNHHEHPKPGSAKRRKKCSWRLHLQVKSIKLKKLTSFNY
jgi:hypothetical protein